MSRHSRAPLGFHDYPARDDGRRLRRCRLHRAPPLPHDLVHRSISMSFGWQTGVPGLRRPGAEFGSLLSAAAASVSRRRALARALSGAKDLLICREPRGHHRRDRGRQPRNGDRGAWLAGSPTALAAGSHAARRPYEDIRRACAPTRSRIAGKPFPSRQRDCAGPFRPGPRARRSRLLRPSPPAPPTPPDFVQAQSPSLARRAAALARREQTCTSRPRSQARRGCPLSCGHAHDGGEVDQWGGCRTRTNCSSGRLPQRLERSAPSVARRGSSPACPSAS